MPQIILAGKDWTARTLLRAQLIEDGLKVEAYENIRAAVMQLSRSKEFPGLLLADLSQSESPADDASQLSQWSKLIPVWILASHNIADAKGLEGRGFEKVLFRPVDLGKLVKQIEERLAG